MTTYTCVHCGRVLSVQEPYVEVCQCAASTQAEQSLRERSKQLARQVSQTFDEARHKNKRPLQGK
jgi:hypothetical protein